MFRQYNQAGITISSAAFCLFVFFIIMFSIGCGESYGSSSPGFTWTIEVVYPIQEDSGAAAAAEKSRNAMFSSIINDLSVNGVNASVDRFRSDKGDVYRIKSQSRTSLSEFRRHFHSKVLTNIPLLSGPARMTISGRVPDSGAFTLALDSNPSTGYHWAVDSSSEAEVVFKQSTYERRAFKYGAAQSQKLSFTSGRAGTAQIVIVYGRTWQKQDQEKIRVRLETDGALPETMDLSDPNMVKETAPSVYQQSQGTGGAIDDTAALPASYDWRTYGIVPDVRDQETCGGCWAFGTVGVMESALKISGWSLPDLSEQFLISCNKNGWNCNGGLTAHKYHYNTLGKNQSAIGAVLETAKPYTASAGTCNSSYSHPYILTGWTFLTADEFTLGSVAQIKSAIYNHGPVTAGICAGDAFNDYVSGVFSTDETATTCTDPVDGPYTNHQIILVGWNDNNGVNVDGYWILRNSWGSSWGESGYMRIKYGTSRVGEGPSYVTVAACSNEAVYNSDKEAYYNSISTGYAAASTGQTLLMQDETFVENLSFTRSIATTLSGGYNCEYSSNSGSTIVSSSGTTVTIGGTGSVTIDKLIIR
jgi:C1A family cysteine protease